jgi:NADH:ubiquinone oxidoreductase subunit 3 (subunit A)
MNKITDSKTKRDRPRGGLWDRAADYILSSVFFIFADLDFAIFLLLALSFDMSPLDMLSLWAAGPVVAGLFVSVD